MGVHFNPLNISETAGRRPIKRHWQCETSLDDSRNSLHDEQRFCDSHGAHI